MQANTTPDISTQIADLPDMIRELFVATTHVSLVDTTEGNNRLDALSNKLGAY